MTLTMKMIVFCIALLCQLGHVHLLIKDVETGGCNAENTCVSVVFGFAK